MTKIQGPSSTQSGYSQLPTKLSIGTSPSETPDEHTQAESDNQTTQQALQRKLQRPDALTSLEANDLELAASQMLLSEQATNSGQRVSYASKIYTLSCVWLAVVVLVTIASGTPTINFQLSDKVLITLLTTTTITVLGLFVTVLKFLFSTNSSSELSQLIKHQRDKKSDK